jgi:selenocysteine lyase/cysteine desulfurase
MESQKHLFQLPADIHYLNCGYMSPLLRSVEEAGIIGIQRKRDPSSITSHDFFNQSQKLREVFGQLVHCRPDQVAIIHSTSFALQNVLNNIPANSGDMAITVTDEFPSDFYAIQRWCSLHDKELKIIEGDPVNRGKSWNEKILDSITDKTAVVILSSIHWMDGTLFDLDEIGTRCKEKDAVLIVDGTQSVGALPMNVEKYNIDVLVCAGYKWLLGPYSIGAAFFSERFNNGVPAEESWLNRANADNFSRLTDYTNEYKPGAGRFSMGEHSNFALTPMLIRSIEQILSWGENVIQEYCGKLISPLLDFLREKEAIIEEDNYRANHLFGFKTSRHIDSNALLSELQKRKIFVSVRGDSIMVSPHLYNDEKDIEALMEALKKII